jgi:glycosyltransferase involved in cell wall biosynthesis
MTGPGPVPGRLRVAIVAANTFEHESRLLKTASTLAEDGHAVTVVAFAGPGLPTSASLAERVELRRVTLDRRIGSGLRPLPAPVRSLLLRATGLPGDAETLPAGPAHGGDRLRAPLRRGLEILATIRRGRAWSTAVAESAPGAEVVHAKALIALPVAREAAHRTAGSRGRFVYDVADLHTESARLVKLPGAFRALIRRRERGLVREAAGVLAATPSMAREIARRFGVAEPVVLLNCPPAWRPETPGSVVSERLRLAVEATLRDRGQGARPATLPSTPTSTSPRPIVLYQGAFRVDQGIEELVAAFDDPLLVATGAVAAFLGFGHLAPWLALQADARPDRMVVLPAVPEGELLDWTAGADLAFVGAPPRTLNQRLTLPNKLFQSLMAGVPIVVGEGTEHCRLTQAEGVGRCCDVESPGSIATAIVELLALSPSDRDALRLRCRTVALERYSWETAREGLIAMYRRLAATDAGAGR